MVNAAIINDWQYYVIKTKTLKNWYWSNCSVNSMPSSHIFFFLIRKSLIFFWYTREICGPFWLIFFQQPLSIRQRYPPGNENVAILYTSIKKWSFNFKIVFSITVMVIIYWNLLMSYQIFFSLQVKRSTIISNKYGRYELPHKLFNDLWN